jgi:hypothetical protein
MNFWVKKPYVLEKSDDALSTLAGEASFDFSFFKKLLGWIKKKGPSEQARAWALTKWAKIVGLVCHV